TRVLLSLKKIPKNFGNFPERYIKKQTQFIAWQPPNYDRYQRDLVNRWREEAYYDAHPVWSREFQDQNSAGAKQPRIFVEPYKHQPVFKGDIVQLLVGPDKGKQGTVVHFVRERNWVYVDNMNVKFVLYGNTPDSPGICYGEPQPMLL